ncbi:MAG: hypothetical protein FWC58_00375 [Desulfobulbus sp.]|nr:hypothetical protein [Desulfobulbus sp.]
MKRTRPRRVAERLIAVLRSEARILTSAELATLALTDPCHITQCLAPELAAGIVATYRENNGRGGIRYFAWAGGLDLEWAAKPPNLKPRGASPRRNVPTTTRACLCCGRPFASAGPHNRLCVKCRAQDVSPYAP